MVNSHIYDKTQESIVIFGESILPAVLKLSWLLVNFWDMLFHWPNTPYQVRKYIKTQEQEHEVGLSFVTSHAYKMEMSSCNVQFCSDPVPSSFGPLLAAPGPKTQNNNRNCLLCRTRWIHHPRKKNISRSNIYKIVNETDFIDGKYGQFEFHIIFRYPIFFICMCLWTMA